MMVPQDKTGEQFVLQHYPSSSDSNLFLASECLDILCQAEYRNPSTAAAWLKKNILERRGREAGGALSQSRYQYAALFFHKHVAAVSDPPGDLVAKLAQFLHGVEFVTWSETLIDLQRDAGFGGQIRVFNHLRIWAEKLFGPVRHTLRLDNFFEEAHTQLSKQLCSDADRLQQYLPLVRLGEYLNAGGQSTADWRKAYETKERVVASLTELRGKEDPLVLWFCASLLREYFWQKTVHRGSARTLVVRRGATESGGDR